MPMKLRLFQYSVFFFFPAIITLFSSCHTDLDEIRHLTNVQYLPTETMKDGEILYSDSAKVKMKLTAPQIDHYIGERNYIEMPKGMRMDFFNDSLKVDAWMKANYGIRYEKEQVMEARRKVEVVNVRGEKLNTEKLILDEKKDSIFTDVFVKITTKDEVLWGNGLESNRDFSRYVIKNIKGIVNIRDEDKAPQP